MEKLLRPQEVAAMLGVHPQTLRMWDRRGRLKPIRLPSGQRRYRMSDLEPMLQIPSVSEVRAVAVYARVSTRKKAEAGNLERQRSRLVEYAAKNGYHVVFEAVDTASGLNTHRRGLHKIIEGAKRGEFHHLLIEYPDRLARFGYEYLRELFDLLGVTIVATAPAEDEDEYQRLLGGTVHEAAAFTIARRAEGRREPFTPALRRDLTLVRTRLLTHAEILTAASPKEGSGRVRAGILKRLAGALQEERLLRHNQDPPWRQRGRASPWSALVELRKYAWVRPLLAGPGKTPVG